MRERDGETRVMTVGRVKVEQRQMVLVEVGGVRTGKRFAALLQNAETVRLVTASRGGGAGGVGVDPGRR